MTWQVWAGACESIFLTSSLVTLMLLAGDPHLERHCVSTDLSVRQTVIKTLMALQTLLFDEAGDIALGGNKTILPLSSFHQIQHKLGHI